MSVDLLLIFPPQWSAFQPSLSLPSLSAWLKRAGFDIASVDINIDFYEWLLSDDCARLLIKELEHTDLTSEAKIGLRAIFQEAETFRSDIDRFRTLSDAESTSSGYFERGHLGVQSLSTYLNAVSAVCDDFIVSPFEFRFKTGNLRSSELERMIDSPHPVLDAFVRQAVAKYILPLAPKSIGISCIGQEQLYFTLLLGSILKKQLAAPVMVGGTIFSRIFERGALKNSWFDRFFDIIVRNEGEKPAERMLRNLREGRPLTEGAPSIVFRNGGEVVSSPPCPSLRPQEIPIPDFEDMPLTRYLSAETTLPLLSSRGCYWGKCEFCHHGMVYGEKYAGYEVSSVLQTVKSLAEKYNVRHFAFNDEAIPPKIARSLGQIAPPNAETGWSFTGLIKFEEFFKREDFTNLHRIGFRSLYVGLESASERVLRLMRKNTRREVMVRNLTDATCAGIWMHCFLFFGFPGETEEEANETFDFILGNSDIISSFGAGSFSLEHNAPVFRHLADFGITLKPTAANDVDVYYSYEVADGITSRRASEWSEMLNAASRSIPSYHGAGWVPRELLLCMLSKMTPGELVDNGLQMRALNGIPPSALLSRVVTRMTHPNYPNTEIAINRVNGSTLSIRGGALRLLEACSQMDLDFGTLQQVAPILFTRLFPSPGKSGDAASEKHLQG
ncbi:B12-binding domain-containing radical SAM protein [Streptomyces sp. NPDC005794]|uniref:B12-binding domain-containing radical SAM protein n=1 Tax=Streptomyces sp. NPDC005794 TaxID=3364733 RepID=UPI003688A0C3